MIEDILQCLRFASEVARCFDSHNNPHDILQQDIPMG
jgi:hypothetical protein